MTPRLNQQEFETYMAIELRNIWLEIANTARESYQRTKSEKILELFGLAEKEALKYTARL